jgi:hypothetical protein
MDGMTLAVFLHLQATDVWELVALIGPFAVVFAAGVSLIIVPIVRAGGEGYQHREYKAGEEPVRHNGNGSGHEHPAPRARKVAKPASSARRRD